MARVKRKSAKKAAGCTAAEKHHLKAAGFNAFGAQAIYTTKRKARKFIRCTEVEPPETGIHSLAWANAIVPQSSGLFRLPVEVRHKIYDLVFQNLSCGTDPIQPKKKGNRFYSPNWSHAAQETIAFSETCRQMYVDVVGGALLYKAKQFSFTPCLMLNYLWVINPAHKNAMRSIHLYINAVPPTCSLPSKAFRMLADLPSLQDLTLEIGLDSDYRILRYAQRLIPYHIITKLRTCQSLRAIKGLQSFSLRFTAMANVLSGQLGSSGYPVTKWGPILVSGEPCGPYYELEQELKTVLVVKR